MNNIICTIPKNKFPGWKTAERVCRMCDGTTIRSGGKEWFWLINTQRKPQKPIIGSVCFMVFAGRVRGYFDIVNIDHAENWNWHNGIGRTGYSIVMANWHPYAGDEEYPGFQGWRYTHLRP